MLNQQVVLDVNVVIKDRNNFRLTMAQLYHESSPHIWLF